MDTAVGLCVSGALVAIMKEYTRYARSTHARGYTIPLRCHNIYMFRRGKHDQDDGKLTASITNLDTSLTDVNGDDFPHAFVRIRDVMGGVRAEEDRGGPVRLLMPKPRRWQKYGKSQRDEPDHGS